LQEITTEESEPKTPKFRALQATEKAKRDGIIIPPHGGPRGSGHRPPNLQYNSQYNPQYNPYQLPPPPQYPQWGAQQQWGGAQPQPWGAQFPMMYHNFGQPPPAANFPFPPQNPGGMPGVQPPSRQHHAGLKDKEQVIVNRDIPNPKDKNIMLLTRGSIVYVEDRVYGDGKIRVRFFEPGGKPEGRLAVLPRRFVDEIQSEDEEDVEIEEDVASEDTDPEVVV
tara:strand:+ start:615 stop:1283 length:669 start_codon:yes stop_codon:yes gene_type:complete